MRVWATLIVILVGAVAASSGQSSSPLLTQVSAPYPALAGSVPIEVAGANYGPGWVAYGPIGTPLTLSGSGFGATQSTSTVNFVGYYKNTVTGAETTLAPVTATTVTSWSSTSISVVVPQNATTGLITVTVGGLSSYGAPFVVTHGSYASACPASVAAGTLRVTTTALSNGTVSQVYSTQIQATGGTGNYSWSILDGELPEGLSLSSSGVISGTPRVAEGPVEFTAEVVDNGTLRQAADATLSLKITDNPAGQSSTALYSFVIQTTAGGSGYDPVGNVTTYTDSVNGAWSLTYDSLNRLATGAGVQANNPYPNLCWQYDNFGNRLSQASSVTAFNPTQNGGAKACPTTSGPSVSASYNSNNWINDGSHGYDAAGNLTVVPGNQYQYDGDGRMCAVASLPLNGSSVVTEYLYDAEGNRVAKGTAQPVWSSAQSAYMLSCDTTQNGFVATTVYVLGPGGEQMTELTKNSGSWQWAHTNVYAAGQLTATYDADPTGSTEGSMYFHLGDWLGTRRQQTDYSGNPCMTFTSLPYGDGLTPASIPCLSPSQDPTEHHYTGKERDSESGNDYFGARYYTSSMGRFMSPDPSAGYYADPTNPQSLNLYVYVMNNPLANIDPTGMDCVTDTGNNTVSYNTGDCENGSQGGDANKEYYIDCDGCTSGATGAHLDSATGDLYLTDAYGNGMAGTTIQGFRDPQGVSTDIEVNGNNQIVGGGGYGAAGFLNADPYANLPMLPNLSVRDPFAPPTLPKLKGKDKVLCLWGGMTNEMLGGDHGPSDSSDTAPGKGGAEPVRKVKTYQNGKSRQVGPKMGVDEGSGAKADGYVLFGNYSANALACMLN